MHDAKADKRYEQNEQRNHQPCRNQAKPSDWLAAQQLKCALNPSCAIAGGFINYLHGDLDRKRKVNGGGTRKKKKTVATVLVVIDARGQNLVTASAPGWVPHVQRGRPAIALKTDGPWDGSILNRAENNGIPIVPAKSALLRRVALAAMRRVRRT